MHEPFEMHERAAAGMTVRGPIGWLGFGRIAWYYAPAGCGGDRFTEAIRHLITPELAADIGWHHVGQHLYPKEGIGGGDRGEKPRVGIASHDNHQAFDRPQGKQRIAEQRIGVSGARQ